MPDTPTSSPPQPALVALAAWVLPGAGYALLGQYARAITIGLTILLLFVLGLLIGGIRALEVPGYSAHGGKLIASWVQGQDRNGRNILSLRISDSPVPPGSRVEGWVLVTHPLDELRAKPWSIAQIMMGPVDVLCDWWSVVVSQPSDPNNPNSPRIAARSHSRINELGVLFTAVAGMLNLLAIIDSSHRAGQMEAK
ncbi:MAG TPA: DUF6677 family protein [Tepidisphaeraceae bacterium]|jgi:hypothetical protein|nr:DUF6677 family protein [Tepidisphaeraceae bacterium]